MLSSYFSSESPNKLLPEIDDAGSESDQSQDSDPVIMGPPKLGVSIGRARRAGVTRYEPSIYRCTGYDVELYEWFSGLANGKDQRFLIDLERGTMDR
jgi:hypothetical protein